MDEPIVMHADVHERAERRDVRDDAFEHHALLEILHRRDVVAELRRRELRARIAPGLRELARDVAQRRLANVPVDVLREIELVDELGIADQLGQLHPEIRRHLLDERIPLRVNRGPVERVLRVVDPQEASCLFECLGSEA